MKGRGNPPVRHRRRSCARSARRSRRRSRASSSPAASSSGPRWRRSSASSPTTSACGTWSASRTAPTRSRSRCTCLGVGPGDDVVVPSFTFYASAEAIPHTGARPVFCDVDPETFCVTPETVERALTPDTRAVIAGRPVRARGAGRRAAASGLPAAASRSSRTRRRPRARACGGQRAGSRSATSATFSFFPSKNLFCLGDGGAIATDDAAVAEQARLLRFHGSRDKSTLRGGRVELAPRRDPGRGAARDPGPPRRLERAPPRAGRRLRRRRASAKSSRCRRPRRRRSPSTTCS